MKRAFDLSVALVGLAIASPFLAAIAVGIWLQDFASPFYVPLRMARGGGAFPHGEVPLHDYKRGQERGEFHCR